MIVALEAYTVVKNDVKDLIQKHWEDIALNQDKIKLNPNWEAYANLDRAGMLRFFTARQDGDLIGYFLLIVNRSLHYKDHLFANNDILFLHPDHRKGIAGLRLIKFAEKSLRDEGVSLMNVNTKVHAPFDVIMERMGFNLIERIYSKYLGE